MTTKKQLIVSLSSALLITTLFHKQGFGLNLLIFEGILLIYWQVTSQIKLGNMNQMIVLSGLVLTAIFNVITHSTFVLVINLISVLCFTGILIYPESRSLVSSMGMCMANFLSSQLLFFRGIMGMKLKGRSLWTYLRSIGILILPIVIVAVFIYIYRISNPAFNEFIGKTYTFIEDQLEWILVNIKASLISTFVLGIIISNILFFRNMNNRIAERDRREGMVLMRTRPTRHKPKRILALKDEYKAGVFLFGALNIFLLILNAMDLYWVWIFFEWKGQYLKQFVHEGTYMLILSILISMALVLYYFRGNLNFYRPNSLRYLVYIWLAQNALLALSVAVRNFRYIEHFALAYKRIGILIFLALTLFGLFSVIIKVKNKKSLFYLMKINAVAIFVILVMSSLPNWDSLIARYNFKHANHSFLHLDYLATLPDKTLPYLEKPLEALDSIARNQALAFPFEHPYMNTSDYHSMIQLRISAFTKKWESTSWLSWNLADHQAYQKLQAKH